MDSSDKRIWVLLMYYYSKLIKAEQEIKAYLEYKKGDIATEMFQKVKVLAETTQLCTLEKLGQGTINFDISETNDELISEGFIHQVSEKHTLQLNLYYPWKPNHIGYSYRYVINDKGIQLLKDYFEGVWPPPVDIREPYTLLHDEIPERY